MRIVIVDTNYSRFLDTFYGRHHGVAAKPYGEQLRLLMEQCFGTFDAYSRAFRRLGHEAVEIIPNCEPLQRRWAQENGLAENSDLGSIALAQVEAFAADLVYFQDPRYPRLRDLDALRRDGRFLVAQIASRSPAHRRMRRFDLILTSFPHYVERYRSRGIDCEYLPLAFEPVVGERLARRGVDTGPDIDRHGVSFVGNMQRRTYPVGTPILERIADAVDLQVFGYGHNRLPGRSPLRRRYRGEAWGLDMYEVLARSQMTINRHNKAAEGKANNMRLFEATGVGTLLLTEAAPNLSTLFEPEVEVVSYTGHTDLLKKIRYYEEHDDERRAVAAAGQARTLSEHTYASRIAVVCGMLERRIKR